jgi:hypothetical protein
LVSAMIAPAMTSATMKTCIQIQKGDTRRRGY